MLKKMLRRQVQSFVYRCLLRELPKPYEHVTGYCWRSRLPIRRSAATASDVPDDSSLLLFEDQRYLGPPNSRRKYIESIGRGWYCEADQVVYFSTADNTDPNDNQRDYAYSTSRWLHSRNSGAANNLLRRETTDAAIARDVEYALGGMKYQDICQEVGIHGFIGKSVLEIGPGPSCAWALLLACRGADVTVVDPYPALWDESYHPAFFAALLTAVGDLPDMDPTPIRNMLDDREFSERVLRRHDDPIEQSELRDESFDFVFSNAVGEHFYDSAAAFRQLYRVTKPGGWGFHWIDFRDHRDFTSPLEYLLMSESEFAREFGLRRGEIGNRLRADEMSAIVERAGFEIVRREQTILADGPYLEAFVPRLRNSASPYRDTSQEELQVLGELLVLRKPDRLATGSDSRLSN